MDFHEYWELIPNNEKYESIGQEIVKFKRNLYDSETTSRDLSEDVISFLQKHLLEFPYPTHYIIYQIIDLKDHEKNEVLEKIILNTIVTLIDMIIENPLQLDKKFKLLNLLSNVYVSEYSMQKVAGIIVPALYDLKQNRGLLDDVLYFALLSRSSLAFLNQYLDYEHGRLLESFSQKSLFLKCYYQRKHWLEDVLHADNDHIIRGAFNETLYNHIALYRLILRMDKTNFFDNPSLLMELDNINSSVIEHDILSLSIVELQRQKLIAKFVQETHSNGVIDTSKSHLMTQLLSFQINFKMENYENILNILKNNHEMNLLQREKFKAPEDLSLKTEMQLLNEYMIIKMYLSHIIQGNASQESIDVHLSHIRGLLKSINDGNVLFSLLQTVFTLLFLRFEHVRKTKIKKKGSEPLNSSTSGHNNSNSTEVSDNVFIDSQMSGFVCGKENLEAILNSMRLFLMSLDITEAYKNSDAKLREQFSTILKSVDNALWRLRLVNENIKPCAKKIYSAYEWLEFHINQENSLKMTSDEEKELPKRKVHRKRLKKRSRVFNRSSDDNDEDSENNCHLITESFTENSENRIKSLEMHEKVESIIPKVLMKPESLVALNLTTKNVENVDKIIKDYHLEDSDIASEVKFIRNYENTLKDLTVVTEKYEAIYDRLSRHEELIDVNKIKIFAEAGFEVAKLVDILDNYCEQQDLRHIDADDVLLERLLQQHPKLSIYQKEFLKISSLIDFVVSMPSTFELNQNIFKFITKRWSLDGKETFYITFMKRIMGIQALLLNYDKKMTVNDILNEEVFTLQPAKFQRELENRESLKVLMSINDETLDDEPMLQDVMSKMTMFKSDINYVNRVVNYTRNTRLMTKFQTNEFFKMNEILCTLNVSDIIGNIIFVNQYNPEHLSNFAFNSNINLLHTIAIAGVGEISPSQSNKKEDEKLLSLFYLSEIGGKSIELSPSKKCETFAITNTDILYYIKKSSFLLAYLLKDIQNFDYKSLKYEDEMNFYHRMGTLESVDTLKSLFNENVALASLNYDFIDLKLLFTKIEKLELKEKLKMLACLTEKSLSKHKVQFNELKDFYLEMQIEKEPNDIIQILNEIGNIKKFCELLLKNVVKIKDDEELERLFGYCLALNNRSALEEVQQNELEAWLNKLKIYQEILRLFKSDESADKNLDWIKIMQLAESNSAVLVNYLLNMNTNLDLCYEMLKIHPLQSRSNEVNMMMIETLNKKELNSQHSILMKIVHTLPAKEIIDFLDFSLGFVNNLSSMKLILKYLSQNTSKSSSVETRREKFKISCKIIEILDVDDIQLWSLAQYPLILLEQLLMNSKIEVLGSIVKELKIFLENEPSCNVCCNMSKNYQIGETLVYDYDPQHKNKWISSDCIDFLLKMYAAKALDFQIIEFNSSFSEGHSSDSSHSLFYLPKEVPSRDKWVADDEAKTCMCCKKSKFSLLNRRHHCRRCGRVICADCSPHRILLPEIYNTLMVRCCEDCFQLIEEDKKKSENVSIERARSADIPLEWKLTGDLANDQMVRDEFNFEYSPNVGLCIAIICLHTVNDDLTKFILFHCHRLELLLRPIHGKINPEIDIVLVAKMLKYLATTAKLFGDLGESNIIIDHADMILKIAENECDSIMSKIPSTNMSVRDTINELIKAENWKLALELSVKWDRMSTSGVFSAWAVSLIKGGQYRLAREKMALALQPVSGSSSKLNEKLILMFNGNGKIDQSKFNYKRPLRSSPLLYEIIEILECTASKKAIMEMSLNSSMSSKLNLSREGSKGKVTNMIENLKKIMEGDYGTVSRKISDKFDWQQSELLKSPYFEESIFYLVSYASNNDIIEFLVKNNLIRQALRYAIIQKVSYESFTQLIFVPITRSGRLGDFMELIKQIDESLWKNYILGICKFLERKKVLHVLYQIQLLTEDYIRASLTSIKFYLDGSGNYSELHEKARHLNDAENHLQTELERVEHGIVRDEHGIQLKWDIKSINAQINVISLQLEVSKFLAKCESDGLPTLDLMPKVFMDKISLKTLLGKPHEMNQVAILLLICGHSVYEAFGLVYRIIQVCSLKPSKIYTTCTKYLARDVSRLMEVEKLINCIKTNLSSSSDVDAETEKMCDELVALAVEIAYTQHQSEAKTQIDQLIKLISNKTMKIQCYINSNQLKTAFVNCASTNNLDYIKRIMKQAEITRQENIRRLCEKKLIQHQRMQQQQGMSGASSTSDISNM